MTGVRDFQNQKNTYGVRRPGKKGRRCGPGVDEQSPDESLVKEVLARQHQGVRRTRMKKVP